MADLDGKTMLRVFGVAEITLSVCEKLAAIFPETDMSEMDVADFSDRARDVFSVAQEAKAAIAKAEGK